MTAHLLACEDAEGRFLGFIVCDDDEAYAQAIEKIKGMDLKDQRPGDLPTLEELKGAQHG